MKKISEKTLFEGEWLLLKESVYIGSDGKEVKWESVERNRSRIILVIIAKLMPSNRHVLIKQYRPAINNYVISFPAGISEDEDISKEALKELKEETGYYGKITSISPVLKSNFGIINESSRIITAEIDEKDKRNLNPKQSLEPEEEIEVIIKKEEEIEKFLRQEKEKGCEIAAGVWYIYGIK